MARALDALSDPFVGWLSDRTQTRWGRRRPDMAIGAPLCGSRLGQAELLDRGDAAGCGLDGPASLGRTQAYLDNVADRGAPARRLALAATRLGNDPHNQEIAQCMLEDFAKNRSLNRDRILLACAQQTAAHRKYGDPLEASRRFGEAMGIDCLQ